MSDNRQMRAPSESQMSMEGQQNAGGDRRVVRDGGYVYYDEAPRSEYPRMMYKLTDVEQTQEHAEMVDGLKDKPMVINRFEGKYLCDTMIAHDASEAEVLASNGWDVSPRAAHGVEDGLVKVVSAKDDEIAELKRQLAESLAQTPEPERRGPGRPPKVAVDV